MLFRVCRQQIWAAGILLFMLLIMASPLMAADRLYFGALVTENSATGNLDTTLSWGEFEGNIPSSITAFNIYRKVATDPSFPPMPLATIGNFAADSASITAMFNEPGESKQLTEMINLLDSQSKTNNPDDPPNVPPVCQNIGPTTFSACLHDILTPGSPGYDSYKRHLLIRYSRDAARAAGLSWIDRNVPAGTFTYMLTSVDSAGAESNPLGMSTVNTSAATLLPAPTKFRQTLVSRCNDLSRELDQDQVHLNWDVPSAPTSMSYSIMVYGYDLFRTERGDMGNVDFNQPVPTDLIKINSSPVLVSGNTIDKSTDDYLAKDEDETLKAGQIYYYYLVSRNLAGTYSAASGPLEVTVADRRGPVMPWNVHAYQDSVESGSGVIPRLMLSWDDTNTINYLKEYKADKTLCSVTEQEVCFVEEGESCDISGGICVEMDVAGYRIYRYDSAADAKGLGTDSDGDGWFDKNDSDPCDPDKPGGQPKTLVQTLTGETLAAAVRTLASGKKIVSWTDSDPLPDNKVHWYRVSGIDANGNPSQLSPPARGVLWDRSQPEAKGTLWIPRCEKKVIVSTNESSYFMIIGDSSGTAASYRIFESTLCSQTHPDALRLVLEGSLLPTHLATISKSDVEDYVKTCSGSDTRLVVNFYNSANQLIAGSDLIVADGFPDVELGTVALYDACQHYQVDNPGGTGTTNFSDKQNVLCADLREAACARIYQKMDDHMFPSRSFCKNDQDIFYDNGLACIEVNIEQMASTETCLGLRVFSDNHIGSAFHYFDCVTEEAPDTPPPAPEMLTVNAQGTPSDPEFQIRWSSIPEGVAGFILEGVYGEDLLQKTYWNLQPEEADGPYSVQIPITASQTQNQWCFRVRMIDRSRTMQMSPWSGTLCATWGTPANPPQLGWPSITEPSGALGLTAFLLEDIQAGAVVLSGPLTLGDNCEVAPDMRCTGRTDYSCVGEKELSDACDVQCTDLRANNRYGDFVLYRQEAGRDFIKVSPLVDSIYCWDEHTEGFVFPHINDPLVYLVTLMPGSVTASSAVQAELEGTTRLIFADWFPHKQGTQVRYRLIRFDSIRHEPLDSVTSDWVQF